MPNNRPTQSTVSIVPEMYIQVAGGLKPALTKNSSVAGTVILPTIWGTKNSAQMMRRILNSFSRLNLSVIDILSPGSFLCGDHLRHKSHFLAREPTPYSL